MPKRRFITWTSVGLLAVLILAAAPGAGRSGDSDAAKAHALVDAAIKMTDSDQAVKLLWQATDIDPTLEDAYIYLALFYNSRSQFDKVIEVYRKLLKYQPKVVSAYLNIGEAYMSFSPPKYSDALAYYEKAYKLDPTSTFAALRIGEILAHQGSRDEAIRFLKQVIADSARNPTAADEARKMLTEMGAS
jgi:tetratricopeptide (TPR) repeat protein